MNIFNTYIDAVGIICIPLIIAIFAFALPLLLQTAARIDDKYNSTLLIKVFKMDRCCKLFLRLLLCSLSFVVIWFFQFKSLINVFVINYSALILLAFFSFVLILATIGVVHLTYIYYVPGLLLERLIKQHERCENEQNRKLYLEAISKILFYSINKSDESLARSVLQFYYNLFFNYREGKENQIIEYPDELYNNIFEANELLCRRKRKTVSSFNDSTLYDCLIDEYQHTIISDKTFHFLWMCHIQSLSYGKDDFITSYWGKAHQYFSIFLNPIDKIYDETYTNILNKEEIKKRNQERERFLEFHYALGGLLMYKGKYNLIYQITSWTNQTPPKYVLVTETMEEVINRFMDVSKKGGYLNPLYYEKKYPFPDVSGVNADEIIKMWIKRYIAILFLRQYTLHEYFVYSLTLEMPNIPKTLAEKRRWNEELDGLKYFVDDYLSQEDILKQLGLQELFSPKWFTDNNKTCPDTLIGSYKQKIEDDIEQTKLLQDVDENKKAAFYNATKKILSNTYEEYGELFGKIVDADYNKLFYRGRYQLMDRAAFAYDQEIGYVNAETIVAETISVEFKRDMLNVFMLMSKFQYLLTEQDLFKAIDQLDLNKDDFSIIAIGVNLDYFQSTGKKLKEKDKKWTYDEIPIIDICNTMNDFFTQSFLIIKNEDLPCIIHNKISEGRINKYRLENIDQENNTYASIINLNKTENAAVKDEVIKSTNVQDLSKSVLVCVDINTEVRCKKSSRCIQLKLFSQFEDKGTPNKVDDVKNIWGKDKVR